MSAVAAVGSTAGATYVSEPKPISEVSASICDDGGGLLLQDDNRESRLRRMGEAEGDSGDPEVLGPRVRAGFDLSPVAHLL